MIRSGVMSSDKSCSVSWGEGGGCGFSGRERSPLWSSLFRKKCEPGGTWAQQNKKIKRGSPVPCFKRNQHKRY
jgi:hypothetical protein